MPLTPEGLDAGTSLPGGLSSGGSYLLSNPMVEADQYPTSLSLGSLSRNFTYYANGQLQTASDYAGKTNTYTYTDGRLTGVTGPTGETLAYSYDSWDKIQSITYGDGGLQSFTYAGAKHQLEEITLPSGRKINFSYDSTTGRARPIRSSPTGRWTRTTLARSTAGSGTCGSPRMSGIVR